MGRPTVSVAQRAGCAESPDRTHEIEQALSAAEDEGVAAREQHAHPVRALVNGSVGCACCHRSRGDYAPTVPRCGGRGGAEWVSARGSGRRAWAGLTAAAA
jgi:hypothetical protein